MIGCQPFAALHSLAIHNKCSAEMPLSIQHQCGSTVRRDITMLKGGGAFSPITLPSSLALSLIPLVGKPKVHVVSYKSCSQCREPPSYSGIRVLNLHTSTEGGHSQSPVWSAGQPIPELLDGPLDRQGLLFHHRIKLLCRTQFPFLSPVSDAYVCMRKGRSKWEFLSTWALVRTLLSCWNTHSIASAYHTRLACPFLVRSESGEIIDEKLGTNLL